MMSYLGQCRCFEGLGQELSPYFKAQTFIIFILYLLYILKLLASYSRS